MKALIAIFIVLVAVWAFTQFVGYYGRTAVSKPSGYVEPPPPAAPSSPSSASSGDSLPGLPSNLDASLAKAREAGHEELGKWLKQWSRQIQDPRLASIELDYVVMLNVHNHKAARERFLQVANRIEPGSPVFERIRKLAPAYEE